MASYIFVSLIFATFCILVSSYPFKIGDPPFLPQVVLDTKKDCNITNHEKAITLFPSHFCDVPLPKFENDFFKQRNFLACFGIYDSLYHLCEFDINDVDLKVPESFKDPSTYCQTASSIYKQLNFSHETDEVTNWSRALTDSMINAEYCRNLCILGEKLNSQCSAMLTAANEYLRLKAIKPTKKDNPENLITTITQTKNEEHPLVAIANPNPQLSKETKLAEVVPQSHHANLALQTSTQSELNKTSPQENGIAPEIPYDGSKFSNVLDISNENSPAPSITTGTNLNATSENIKKEPAVVDSVLPNDDHKQLQEANPTKQLKQIDSPQPFNNLSISPVISPKSTTITHIEKIASNQQQDDIFKDDKVEQPDESTDIDPQNAEMDDVEFGSKPLDEGKPVPKDEDEPVIKPDAPPDWDSNIPLKDHFVDTEDSYTFSYFATIAILCFVAYFLFHYKNKLLALALEGRKTRNKRGRPSSANYSKLHSNLEEAIASNISTPSATHVLY